MKKIIASLALTCMLFACAAQPPARVNFTTPKSLAFFGGNAQIDSALSIPKDTIMRATWSKTLPHVAMKNDTLYAWSPSANKWKPVTGRVPTLQQVLTAGRTLTQDNDINGGGHTFSITNPGSTFSHSDRRLLFIENGGGQIDFDLNSSAGMTMLMGDPQIGIAVSGGGFPSTVVANWHETYLGDYYGGGHDGHILITDSIAIAPTLGRINIDSLRVSGFDTTRNKPTVWDAVTGMFRVFPYWPGGSGGGGGSSFNSIYFENIIKSGYDTLSTFIGDSVIRLKAFQFATGSTKLSLSKVITDTTISVTYDVVPGNILLSALGGSLNVSQINATGTPSSTTFLRGDGSWAAGGGISGLTTSKIPYATSATAIGNTTMHWDNTNSRLGLGGQTSPAYTLDITGTLHTTSAAVFDGNTTVAAILVNSGNGTISQVGSNIDYAAAYSNIGGHQFRVGNGGVYGLYLNSDQTVKMPGYAGTGNRLATLDLNGQFVRSTLDPQYVYTGAAMSDQTVPMFDNATKTWVNSPFFSDGAGGAITSTLTVNATLNAGEYSIPAATYTTTSNATVTTLSTMTIASPSSGIVEISVVGNVNGTTATIIGKKIVSFIKTGGTLTILQTTDVSPIVTSGTLSGSGATFTVSVNGSNNLQVQVTGKAATSMTWTESHIIKSNIF